MIILKKLKWGFWFSYGDNNEIDFTADIVTQILGTNGNGKSSIPLIVEEMLFNKNSKGIKKADIPNRYANKGYWGDLTFSKDEDDYRIELDRKTNIKIKLYRNGHDISAHTATNTFKIIEELIGTDFKTFSQLVYQNTNTSLQFLVATDTNRKKFFIDLLSMEEYVAWFEVFKDAVKQHATIVSGLEGQINTVERWLDQNKLLDLSLKTLEYVDDIDLTADERKYAEIGVKVKNIEKTNAQINRNNQYRQLLESIDIASIQSIDAEHRVYDDSQSELGALQSQRTRGRAYISRLEGLGNSCPTCEQSIDSEFKHRLISKEREELESVEEKIKLLSETIDNIKRGNVEFDRKQKAIKEWEELFSSVDPKLPRDVENKLDLQQELSDLAIRISNAKAKVREAQARNTETEKHNSRVQVYLEQSAKFEKELKEASEKLEIEMKNLSSLELLKKAFSTNGLIAYKIENQVKDLEILTNEYLAELSDGRFTIEFSVNNDKLNVHIGDNGNTIDISALSSGELARVNTATLLALRKLMSSISKSKINVLFLDEVISVLDEPGRDRLVEVLLQEDLNTYIVSHSWSHPLLAKLDVVKIDNMSSLEHG